MSLRLAHFTIYVFNVSIIFSPNRVHFTTNVNISKVFYNKKPGVCAYASIIMQYLLKYICSFWFIFFSGDSWKSIFSIPVYKQKKILHLMVAHGMSLQNASIIMEYLSKSICFPHIILGLPVISLGFYFLFGQPPQDAFPHSRVRPSRIAESGGRMG